MALKVVGHRFAVLSDFTKVNAFAALEQQQTIEHLEEGGAWLMDGAKNTLSTICKPSQQRAD